MKKNNNVVASMIYDIDQVLAQFVKLNNNIDFGLVINRKHFTLLILNENVNTIVYPDLMKESMKSFKSISNIDLSIQKVYGNMDNVLLLTEDWADKIIEKNINTGFYLKKDADIENCISNLENENIVLTKIDNDKYTTDNTNFIYLEKAGFIKRLYDEVSDDILISIESSNVLELNTKPHVISGIVKILNKKNNELADIKVKKYTK